MAELKSLINQVGQMLSEGKQKKIDLLEFMQTCQALFEECGTCLETGTGREKDEMLKELFANQQVLEGDIESLVKETGKSLEQMHNYIENPDNFSQEAWQVIQKTWRQVTRIKGKRKTPSKTSEKQERGDSTSSWDNTKYQK